MALGEFIVLGVGVCFSVFYGLRAADIFLGKPHLRQILLFKRQMSLAWCFHQFCFNFIGCAFGWFAVYYLIFYRFLPSLHSFSFGLADVVPVVIALLGINGYLPVTLSKMTSIKP